MNATQQRDSFADIFRAICKTSHQCCASFHSSLLSEKTATNLKHPCPVVHPVLLYMPVKIISHLWCSLITFCVQMSAALFKLIKPYSGMSAILFPDILMPQSSWRNFCQFWHKLIFISLPFFPLVIYIHTSKHQACLWKSVPKEILAKQQVLDKKHKSNKNSGYEEKLYRSNKAIYYTSSKNADKAWQILYKWRNPY